MVLADERKPWAHISYFVYPIRRRAEFMAFSDSGLRIERIDGNTSALPSDASQISRRTARACRESGMSWGRLIFMRSGGMRHVAFGQIISLRRRYRTSPGRAMVRARKSSAVLSVGQPSYSSIEATNA